MTDVRELEEGRPVKLVVGPSLTGGWQWQKNEKKSKVKEGFLFFLLAYPAHIICKCEREIGILDRSGGEQHVEEVSPVFCGRGAIGRLPDIEGGDADDDGDEGFAAAAAVISYDGGHSLDFKGEEGI